VHEGEAYNWVLGLTLYHKKLSKIQ